MVTLKPISRIKKQQMYREQLWIKSFIQTGSEVLLVET